MRWVGEKSRDQGDLLRGRRIVALDEVEGSGAVTRRRQIRVTTEGSRLETHVVPPANEKPRRWTLYVRTKGPKHV